MDASATFNADHFRRRRWWRDETLADWLSRASNDRPNHLAVVASGGSLTYGDLSEQVHAFAAALQGLNIRRGDVVAVQLPNIPEFIVSWLAINRLGAVMQTVHMPYGPREVEHLLRHGGAKVCIALSNARDQQPARNIDALRPRLVDLRAVISVGDALPGIGNFRKMLDAARGTAFRQPVVSGSDRFLQLYTSGTTSAPKAVSVTYNHFLSNARLCAAEFGVRSEDCIVCLAPFTHLYGLYVLELGFFAGATACLLDVFTPAGLITTLGTFSPTMLFGGPAHIAPCLQQELFESVDLSRLRVAVLSGSTVPPSLSAAFERKLPNGKVLQAWGMTELQFGACSRPDDSSAVRFETIGRATPGTELRVANPDGLPLAPGEVGELHMRGCSLFGGYVRNPEADHAAFLDDGWFRTGDLARMDAFGNVQLNGRTKELINRGGIKFNPVDVEAALSAHPAILQVAIAPVPDPELGERACCFAVLREGEGLTFDELKVFLAESRFAKFTWPESLVIVPDMPVTPTRKVIKSELVTRYWPGRHG